MEISQYQAMAARTIPEDAETKELLVNFCLGLFGESGELVDHIKKHVYHGHPLDLDYVAKELGDMQWYNNGIATALQLSMDTIAFSNIKKLRERYPNGFSEQDSINRKEE